MVSLEQFKENAFAHGICDEFREKWKDGLSNKRYIDMALSVKGADYLMRAYAQGWGISKEAILSRFKAFINGKYILDNGKYLSQLYCGFKGKMVGPTTLLSVIDSRIFIELPSYSFMEIYITGKDSFLSVEGGKCVSVHIYGDTPESNIVLNNVQRGKVIKEKL